MFGRDWFSIRFGFWCRVPATLVSLFLLPAIAAAQQSTSLNLSGASTLTSPSQVRAGAQRAEASASLMASKVATLTASLNGLLGLAPDTRLELVAPAPILEDMTLKDALAQAQASPPLEIVEAGQTAVKVKSAYFELERSRDAYYLARKTLPTHEGVSFVSNRSDADSSRARADADVFRAEMAYRNAYATLTNLIAGK